MRLSWLCFFFDFIRIGLFESYLVVCIFKLSFSVFSICCPSASHWIGKSLDRLSHIFAQDRKCYGGCSDCADDFLGRGCHFVLWNRFDEAHSGQGSRKASGEAGERVLRGMTFQGGFVGEETFERKLR